MKSFENQIYSHLKIKNINIVHLSAVDSTNTYLKNLANKDTPEGTVVIADCQTAGVGRFDRRFHSPENTGIYMSILLRPKSINFDITQITTAAAVAVANACEELSGKAAKIKWVNDVYIDNKKVCGILTKGVLLANEPHNSFVILGIGINAFDPANGFHKEIENIAGSVFETNSPNLKAMLTARVIDNFFGFYNEFSSKNHINDYRKKSLVIGKNITVLKPGATLPAKALDIDDECRLLVEYENGETEKLSSGEISIKI